MAANAARFDQLSGGLQLGDPIKDRPIQGGQFLGRGMGVHLSTMAVAIAGGNSPPVPLSPAERATRPAASLSRRGGRRCECRTARAYQSRVPTRR